MIDPNVIIGKAVALVLWNSDVENDVHVYLGELIKIDTAFHFVNREKNWNVLLDDEQLEKLKEVPGSLKEMLLNAEYTFSLSMSGIPGDSAEAFTSTGMKWHQ